MVNITFTMTCNHCYRYLKAGTGTVIEAEDLPSILDAAEARGWELKWLPGDAGEAPSHCLCPECARKEESRGQ